MLRDGRRGGWLRNKWTPRDINFPMTFSKRCPIRRSFQYACSHVDAKQRNPSETADETPRCAGGQNSTKNHVFCRSLCCWINNGCNYVVELINLRAFAHIQCSPIWCVAPSTEFSGGCDKLDERWSSRFYNNRLYQFMPPQKQTGFEGRAMYEKNSMIYCGEPRATARRCIPNLFFSFFISNCSWVAKSQRTIKYECYRPHWTAEEEPVSSLALTKFCHLPQIMLVRFGKHISAQVCTHLIPTHEWRPGFWHDLSATKWPALICHCVTHV